MTVTKKDYYLFIQKGLLLFWATWFTLVSCTDLINFLQQLHLISNNIVFTSQNYALVLQVLEHIKINSPRLALVLFALIQLWSWAIAICFWASVVISTSSRRYIHVAYIAWISSCAMTVVFMIFDEIFIAYNIEHGHVNRLCLQAILFLTFIVLERMRTSTAHRSR